MSCLETFSTLRVFSKILSPNEIETILGIKGTQTRIKDPESRYKHKRTDNMWLWSTKKALKSIDTEEHLELIADQFVHKTKEIETLKQNCNIDIISYFVSNGQGGPSANANLLKKLALLGVDIWWDVYFDEDED